MNFNLNNPGAAFGGGGGPSGAMMLVAVLALICGAVVHIAFAVGVSIDSTRLRRAALVPRGIWVLATLLGGPLIGALYYTLHHSSLFPRE